MSAQPGPSRNEPPDVLRDDLRKRLLQLKNNIVKTQEQLRQLNKSIEELRKQLEKGG